ncbi:MAG: hypothetical protein RL685_5219 [Pseudomonadota bacterium]
MAVWPAWGALRACGRAPRLCRKDDLIWQFDSAIAPDFEAQTTEGTLRFHEWLGNGWGILFSHPKDFTPVCTTELGEVAKLEPEFAKRSTKVLALSVDSVVDHHRWSADIEETQGTRPNYPLIAEDQAYIDLPGKHRTQLR